MDSMILTGKDPAKKLSTFNVQVRYSHLKNSKRTIILLPPTGGLTILDHYILILAQLERYGHNVLALTGFNGAWETVPDWEVHHRGLQRGSAACQMMLKWARENWNTKYFGVIGTSMGALFAAMAASYEKDIDRLVLIAGGAPVSRIAAESLHPSILKIKKWRHKNYQITNSAEYAAKIKETLQPDISDVLRPHRHRKDLVVIGKNDKIVPSTYQYELIKLLGKPDVIEINGGHVKTIAVAQTLLAQRICQHLNG